MDLELDEGNVEANEALRIEMRVRIQAEDAAGRGARTCMACQQPAPFCSDPGLVAPSRPAPGAATADGGLRSFWACPGDEARSPIRLLAGDEVVCVCQQVFIDRGMDCARCNRYDICMACLHSCPREPGCDDVFCADCLPAHDCTRYHSPPPGGIA